MLSTANLYFRLTGTNSLNTFDEFINQVLSREAILHTQQLCFVLYGLLDKKIELTYLVEKIKILFTIDF